MLVGECGHFASDLIELWDVWRCSLDFGTFMGFLTLLEIPEGSPVGVWDS